MEPENKKDDRLKSQIQALRSGNRTSILGAISQIRSGSSIDVLPDLFDLLVDQEEEEIIAAINSLLCDLKKQEAVPVLVEAIGNPEYKPVIQFLVAACWQNGLSYSKYVKTFCEVAIRDSYEAAIEAFTVIEEAIGEIEKEERAVLSNLVKQSLEEAEDQKKPLLLEIIKVIESY